MKLPAITYLVPKSVEEAIDLLGRHDGDAKILSGGQSLMPMLAFRLASCSILLDIKMLPNLDRIVVSGDGVELGARVRWRDIERDCNLSTGHPLLIAAVKHIAHYAIRNRGTVGGSLAHGDPASELPALSVTCGATIEIVGPAGKRSVPAESFFVSPLVTVLEANELILSVRFPAWPTGRKYGFREFSRRRGDFAMAGAVVFFDTRDERICSPHVGAFGVGDQPLRLTAAEQILLGQRPDPNLFSRAAAIGVQSVEFRSDIHADADYRRALLETLITRALVDACNGQLHDTSIDHA